MSPKTATAKEEWARSWYLPLTAALGFSAGGLHLYGIGPFVDPIQREFGWSRAQIMSGMAIVSIGIVLGSIPMGALIDRLGSRFVGLIGVLLMSASVALLGTATGTAANWILLFGIIAICGNWVQSPVWTSAVVDHFDKARGLALGVTLCGSSFGVFLMPIVTTWLVESYGWRTAFAGLGAIWALMLFPILFFFFRSGSDAGREARLKVQADRKLLPGITLGEALRTATLYKLLFASAFFALALLGAVINFVPMLTDRGATPMAAAGAASLIGIFSIVGRLGTGAMLDRFSGAMIGAAAFLLPVASCLLLLLGGPDLLVFSVAAALFGLTMGAETDVIVYLATRHFGLRNFGSIQGVLLCAIAIGSATGPIAAGAVFDSFGSYAPFLVGMAALMAVSAVLMASLKNVPQAYAAH